MTPLDERSEEFITLLRAAKATDANIVAVEESKDTAVAARDATIAARDAAVAAKDASAESATETELNVWRTEAEKMTANSHASEAEDVLVKLYTSNNDGTFTMTNATTYSALHHATKGLLQDASSKLESDGSQPMTGNLEVPS